MALPRSTHTDLPWRIHELTRDFRVEDVWALPTPGGPRDFPRLMRVLTGGGDPSVNWSRPARLLWRLRWWIGARLGWDDERARVGSRVPSLRERMDADLRAAPTGPTFAALPFAPLYQLEDEFAAEMANRTVHTVMHIGWVPDGSGGHHAHMAVLVKANGLFGRLYMAAIAPLRHLIVYPTVLAGIGRRWRELAEEATPPAG